MFLTTNGKNILGRKFWNSAIYYFIFLLVFTINKVFILPGRVEDGDNDSFKYTSIILNIILLVFFIPLYIFTEINQIRKLKHL